MIIRVHKMDFLFDFIKRLIKFELVNFCSVGRHRTYLKCDKWQPQF